MALGTGWDCGWSGGGQQPSRSRNPLATTAIEMEQATTLPFVSAQRADCERQNSPGWKRLSDGDTQASQE